jgi:hypothetical protein
MNLFDGPPDEGGPNMIRPFLGRGPYARPEPSGDRPAPADVGVRPYFMTGGRTRTDRPLHMEALVQTTARGRDNQPVLQFEQRTIAALCEHPMSVAEVAARVRVPLGVAGILVSDMAGLGLLQIHDAPVSVHDDIALIQRLIHGVRAL